MHWIGKSLIILSFCFAQLRRCKEGANLSSNSNLVGSFKKIFETVTRIWNSVNYGSIPMKRWQNKIRLRQFLRGSARNVNGNCRKEK
jgi:hypothetical protein